MPLGSQVSSPSPDSAHLEGTSGNLRPCPLKQLTAHQAWLDLTARKTQKQSDSIRAALQAVSTRPQGLEGPPPGAGPWWAPWTPDLPALRRLGGEGGSSRICSFLELRGASSLLYAVEGKAAQS